MKHKSLTQTLVYLLLALTLTGCISMSEDVTPPPGYQQATPTVKLSATAAGDEVNPTGSPANTEGESEHPSGGTGIITVDVTNASGGDLPIEADIILNGYDQMQEVFTQTKSLSEDGVVVFEDVPMPAGRVYLAAVEYEGVSYVSGMAKVAADASDVGLEIMVFDTTTDVSGLVCERMHVFFEFGTDTVRVIQLMLLVNPGPKSVVPSEEGGAVVFFELPEVAANLNVKENITLNYLQGENGFGVGIVRPSDQPYEITFAYDMPYEKEKLDLVLPIAIDTMFAIIITPADGVKVKGEQLQDAVGRDLQGVSYNTYATADELGPGDNLEFSISGLPKMPVAADVSGETDANTDLLVGLGFLGIALIAVGVYIWSRNRGGDPVLGVADRVPPPVDDTPDDLMDAIIALDDLYDDGDLPDDAYVRRRDELKARLQQVIDDR
ncbi:MAG: hypothetical protein U9Q82_12140 [Chloroflexota bacterium]|nr:hypothetical protein [Chloroflexota bacterium]